MLPHLVWTSPRQFVQIQVPISLKQGELDDMSETVNMTIIDMIRASNKIDYSGDKPQMVLDVSNQEIQL